MSIRLKKGKYNILWPISILKYCLPLMSKTFYGQIFILLISGFKCPEGKLYYSSNAKCTIGTWFYVGVPITCIAIIIQLLLSYITISMYYKHDFIIGGKDILKKTSSIPEIIFLFNKMILIITFGFDKEKEYEHWGILFAICLINGLNAYTTLFLQNYENIIIKKFNYFYSLFSFWGFFSLLIGKIFKSWNFSGAFYLFLIGLILILIYCLFYAKTILDFLHIDFNNIKSSQEYINYIKSYLKVIKEKDISRDSSMILTTFINKMEEGCTNNNCILKKYLISLSKGFDSNFLLLQFAQKLFKIALNKFPKNVTLRIHYIMFLLTRLNQKKNAQKELLTIKPDLFFLDNNFKLYICKKYFEEYNVIGNIEKEGTLENNDIIQAMEYKNNSLEFRKLLSKTSYLYYDFWSSLYSSHLQGTEDIKKLNDIGVELNKLIENIELIFEKLRKYKKNDLGIIKLYESYSKNILNDKERYEKYNNLSINLVENDKLENNEKDFSNFSLKIINENDEYKTLVISAEEENKGTIINISLNGSLIFGYHPNEIIGKNMNILIPEIYHPIHNKIFNGNIEKTKTEFFECLSKNQIYTPKFSEFSAFGRNKSKYLIPLYLKIFFVQTEESDLAYIVKFDINKTYSNDISQINEHFCCVLTDNNFIIQTFTSNCVELLGLNSSIINSNYDITSFIKQFNDELQKIKLSSNKDASGIEASERISSDNSYRDINNINNNNDKSSKYILKLKKKLLKLKYNHKRKIYWSINNFDKISNFKSEIGKNEISLFSPMKNRNFINGIEVGRNNFQKKLMMEVKEAYISNKHIGYYFYFKKINSLNEPAFSQFDKNNLENQSPYIKSNLKKPSVKFINENEESAKSSRIYNDDEEGNSIMHKNSNEKEGIKSNKRNSVNFDLEGVNHLRIIESAKMLSNIYDESNYVNDKYIPKCNLNFFLDLESLSFKTSTKLDSCKKLYQSLKFQSMQKLNLIYKTKKKEIIDSSFKSENSSQNSFYSSNESNSSSSNSLSKSNLSEENKSDEIKSQKGFKSKNNIKEESSYDKNISKNNFNRKSININNNNGLKYKNNDIKKLIDFDNEYYKVNINKIKFMIYDFTQEMAINNNKIEKKSQVEIILENYKSKNNINISEDINYPNISNENINKESSNKKYKNNEINTKKKNNQKENNDNTKIFDKKKEFEKEIIYALSKQDEQKSIIFFSQISFIFFILILFMGFFEIFFFIKNYSSLKENLYLLIYSIGLKYLSNTSVYLLREKILLNIKNNIKDGNYKVPHSSTELYKFMVNFELKNAFNLGNTILENIIGTNLKFSKNSSYFLTQKYYDIEILYNNNSCIKNVSNTFYTTLIHVYSSFCNLLSKDDIISLDDSNIYNYIHNSFNSLGNMLNIQIDSFEKDLIFLEKNVKINIIIYSFIFFILHIILYFLINKSYFYIIKKKASYISAFYGIGLPLIKSSIKKCEFFINRMNKNQENEKIKDIDENESSFISSFEDINMNKIFMENNFERKSIYKVIEKTKKIQKSRKLGKDKKSMQFKILYQILLVISFLSLILIFYLFLIFTKYFINCGEYLFNMQNYQNNIFNLFNVYREYLFDENSIIFGLPCYEYLIKKEESFYSSNTENINTLTVLRKNFKNLSQNYGIFQTSGFCNSYIAYFNSKEECANFIGGENGILSLGFHLLINYFVEEIRNARNYMKLLLEKEILIGNLTEIYKLENNETFLNLIENNNLTFRMKVFNLDETHYRLNIIFLNIILQNINQERTLITNSIQNSVQNANLLYIILVVIYIVLFVVFFLFYWIPQIKRVNNEIYKTKKLLSIIPVQILASQPNIKELLNIRTNND